MKIAFVTREAFWGIGVHTRNLAKHLEQLGVECQIFYGDTYFEGNVGASLILWLHRMKNLRKFDLIHVQGSPFGAFAVIIGKPMVLTVHTTVKAEIQHEHTIPFFIALAFEKLTFTNVKKNIAVSNVVVHELVDQYHIREDDIILIPNGINISEFNNLEGTERSPTFIMSCGRNIKRKGFIYLERACKMVGVPLKIFHGELSRRELVRQYKMATMFVSPSLYESFGLTVVEAMAAKCPVICSDIPASRSLVSNGKTGLLFQPRNVSDLAQKIKLLLENGKLRSELVEKAYKFVEGNFRWRDVAKKTLKVYEDLL